MKITYLDVAATHGDKNPCPANRFSMLPDGQWQCVDCGIHIIWKTVDVAESPGESVVSPDLATLKKKAAKGPFDGGEMGQSWDELADLVGSGKYSWMFVSMDTYGTLRQIFRHSLFIVTDEKALREGVVAYLGPTPVVVAPGVRDVVLVAGATYDLLYRYDLLYHVKVVEPQVTTIDCHFHGMSSALPPDKNGNVYCSECVDEWAREGNRFLREYQAEFPQEDALHVDISCGPSRSSD